MKQFLVVFFFIVESLIFIACAGVVVSGFADTWVAQIPYAGYILSAISAAILLYVILSMNKSVSIFSRLRAVIIVCLLAIMAVHVTSQASPTAITISSSPVEFLYFVIIIAYAAMGNGLLAAVALLLCIAGEAANCMPRGALLGIFNVSQAPGAAAYSGWEKLLPPFGAMIAAALVPFLISLLKAPSAKLDSQRKKFALMRQTAEPPREDPQPLHPASIMDTRQMLSGKTSMLIMRQDQEEAGADQQDIDDILSSVVYFMSRNFKAYSALGFVFDPATNAFTLNSFHSKSLAINRHISIPLGRGVVGKVGQEKTAFISGDIVSYNAEVLYYAGVSPVKSIVAVPVISDAKELLGALVIDSQDQHAFKDEHKEILRRFSSLAAALIYNARMRQYQEKTARQFQILYEASQQFISALQIDQVFAVLVSITQQITPYTRIIGLSYSETDNLCTIVKIRGHSLDVPEGFSFQPNAGLYSYALQKQKIVNVADFQEFQGKYYRFTPDEIPSDTIRSLIVLPIMGDASKPVGLLSVEHTAPNCYAGETETILFTLAGNASVAFTRARLYQKMELMAITDGLTQLINHKHFQAQLAKEIERSRRYKRAMSLLILDIDHFKSFNDTYGHQVGDLVLREIAQCIKSVLRTNDIAARYGGEEFAVIIPETAEQGAVATAERIRSAIEGHVIESGKDALRVTISIGAATYPVHGAEQQELIKNADTALYHAKENGRNQACLYFKGMIAHEKK